MASEIKVDTIVNAGGDNDSGIDLSTNDNIKFNIAGSQKAVIDSSGNIMIGHTSLNSPVADGGSGMTLKASGEIQAGFAGTVLKLNREDSDGIILECRKDGTTIGTIGTSLTNSMFIGTTSGGDVGMAFVDEQVRPVNGGTGANVDDTYDIGNSAVRWDDIRATNGTIQTSDKNEKQNIASLSTKELNVAKKLSTLFKTFKWKSKVAKKGDSARTHTGMIAQEIQTAFSDEGLDVSKYAFWCSDTWWEKEVKVDAVKADKEKGIEAQDAYTHTVIEKEKTDGYTERTRLSLRYPELLSFIGAATEQRLASIEARLTALESK